MPKQALTLGGQSASKEINEYLASSIEIFKDDLTFFREVKGFLKRLPPKELGSLAFDSLFDEWNQLECKGKETSSTLQ